jgi:hypothetical protein
MDRFEFGIRIQQPRGIKGHTNQQKQQKTQLIKLDVGATQFCLWGSGLWRCHIQRGLPARTCEVSGTPTFGWYRTGSSGGGTLTAVVLPYTRSNIIYFQTDTVSCHIQSNRFGHAPQFSTRGMISLPSQTDQDRESSLCVPTGVARGDTQVAKSFDFTRTSRHRFAWRSCIPCRHRWSPISDRQCRFISNFRVTLSKATHRSGFWHDETSKLK